MKSVICVLSILIITLNYSYSQVNDSTDTGTFIDSRDNQVYKWVRIGDQIWMAENLAYKPSEGNYWAYDNNSANVAVYGYLYNWETAKKVCPAGWHLPSDAEWTELTDYLGGYAGGKLKEAGTSHWNAPNLGVTNETGFTALPGGLRGGAGDFVNIGYIGIWWSATEGSKGIAWYRRMLYDYNTVDRYDSNKLSGFSVRCVKD